MKILVLGGSKSGKSHIAQEITDSLAQGGTKYYWATMEPVDEEDSARIEKHITDRDGWGFETIECGRNICSKLPVDKNSSVLFDSVTALLANEMFAGDTPDINAHERVVSDLIELSDNLKNIVCVCDEIFRDGFCFDEITEQYRYSLALICRKLAEVFDAVYEVSCGIITVRKGRLLLKL